MFFYEKSVCEDEDALGKCVIFIILQCRIAKKNFDIVL